MANKKNKVIEKLAMLVTHSAQGEYAVNKRIVKKEIDSLEVRDRFYDTIVASPEWKAWYKEMMSRIREANKTMNYKGCYDIDESQECGVISKGHWSEFVKFIRSQK